MDHGWHEKGGIEAFRKKYSNMLNKCVDQRYRQNGFGINWAIFDDCTVSEIIKLQPSDRIIKVGLYSKTHIAKKLYPNQDNILEQLGEVRVIRVAGFHMWDCVEKLAKRAHEMGLGTLVDEDLTEFFSWRLNDRNFKIGDTPPIIQRGKGLCLRILCEQGNNDLGCGKIIEARINFLAFSFCKNHKKSKRAF